MDVERLIAAIGLFFLAPASLFFLAPASLFFLLYTAYMAATGG